MSEPALRWGILSTASINAEVLPAFAASDKAELVAVASRDPERAAGYAREHGIPESHGSYEALLEDGSIDCVYIPLPNALHGEWTRAALEAGRHVLCEKPLTPTADEARGLFELASERGLQLMEAFMYRHHPKTRRLRELVQGGALGEVEVVRSWFHFKTEDRAADIRYDADLAGGSLRDVGCYCISLSTYLYDRAPERVEGSARWADSGVDEAFAATMSFGDGSVAVFDCGMFSPLDVGVHVLGTDGHAIVPMPWYAHVEPLEIELLADGERSTVSTPGGNAYQLEIENFCDAVAGRAEAEIGPEETLRNLDVMERLARSCALSRS
jgi:predicted dehydrogenase